MNFHHITYSTSNATAVITLSRQERTNALNGEMLSEILRAMDAAEADDAVRVIVVTGRGPAFSSGFDLKEQMAKPPSGVQQWRPPLPKDFDVVMRFWRSPNPTIASVRGACLAGAFELMMACDL